MTEKGHGQKLSRHGARVLAALIEHPTVAEAAKASGISQRSIFRWLQRADFMEQFKVAQRAVIDDAIGDLQAATKKAVSTLVKNLDDKSPVVANRAAQIILSQALRGIELQEVLERLAKLEVYLARQLQQQGRRRA